MLIQNFAFRKQPTFSLFCCCRSQFSKKKSNLTNQNTIEKWWWLQFIKFHSINEELACRRRHLFLYGVLTNPCRDYCTNRTRWGHRNSYQTHSSQQLEIIDVATACNHSAFIIFFLFFGNFMHANWRPKTIKCEKTLQ